MAFYTRNLRVIFSADALTRVKVTDSKKVLTACIIAQLQAQNMHILLLSDKPALIKMAGEHSDIEKADPFIESS